MRTAHCLNKLFLNIDNLASITQRSPVKLITGLPMGKPSRGLRFVCLFSFFSFFLVFFFSVSVKVLPVTTLVSGVFVHRAFCSYFLRIERVVELRRFLWWTQ